MAPAHGSQLDELCGAADLALYRAKARGKGCCEIFAPALRDVAASRRAFELELRRAFADGAFEMFYQPQWALPGVTLSGAEALMRWNHAGRGVLATAHFMEVLGRDASAVAVGAWVLRTACRQVATWRRTSPRLRMGVNMFATQLQSDAIVDVVRDLLAEHALPGDALELELAAGMFVHDDAGVARRLRHLRDLGVGLVLDDYGTAPAPLSLFKHVPISRLKIDRSLIRGIATDRADAAIVDAIFQLARRLGVQVSAKGVETAPQFAVLRDRGCRDAQGHLWGRAERPQDFAAAFMPSREPALG